MVALWCNLIRRILNVAVTVRSAQKRSVIAVGPWKMAHHTRERSRLAAQSWRAYVRQLGLTAQHAPESYHWMHQTGESRRDVVAYEPDVLSRQLHVLRAPNDRFQLVVHLAVCLLGRIASASHEVLRGPQQ
jgi:hypothetical protein